MIQKIQPFYVSVSYLKYISKVSSPTLFYIDFTYPRRLLLREEGVVVLVDANVVHVDVGVSVVGRGRLQKQ